MNKEKRLIARELVMIAKELLANQKKVAYSDIVNDINKLGSVAKDDYKIKNNMVTYWFKEEGYYLKSSGVSGYDYWYVYVNEKQNKEVKLYLTNKLSSDTVTFKANYI